MGRTFYEALLETAKIVADVRLGTATGGSTTTLIDTGLREPDDYFNYGHIFIDQSTPVIKQVLDWALSTGTFTFGTLSSAVTAGITYAVIHKKFPLDVLKNAINTALRMDVGLYMAYDETLVAVDDQERYTLPSGVYDIRRVEIGTEDDTWKINNYWQEENGVIRFFDNLPAEGDTIRLHYTKRHTPLSALTDVIEEAIPWELVINAAVVHAFLWRVNRADGNEKALTDKMNYYKNEALNFKNLKQILPYDPKYGRW